MNKPLAIIVDLDSTLANNDHRQHFLDELFADKSKDQSDIENWKQFKKFNSSIFTRHA